MAFSLDDEDYFNSRKVPKLIRFGFTEVAIDQLRGLHPRFADVFTSWSRNVNRVYSLATLSAVIAVAGIEAGKLATKATHDETGEFYPKKRLSNEQLESIRLRMMPVYPHEHTIGKLALQNRIGKHLRFVIRQGGGKAAAGMDAIIPSLLVLSWTAFEALAEDLLERALEICPQHLSALAGRPTRRHLSAWEGVTVRGNVLLVSTVKQPGQVGRLEYRSLTKIRDSYWLAFSKDYRRVDAAIMHRSIDTLYAIRNIYVHTGGVVDETFLKRTVGLPRFAHCGKGRPLQLDFGDVKEIIETVVLYSQKLIYAVNRWIFEHR